MKSTAEPKKRPHVTLSGTDGNIFALMGRCAGALRKEGLSEDATKMTKEVMTAESYDAALQVLMQYCDVD